MIPTDRPVEVAADLDHRMLMGIQKSAWGPMPPRPSTISTDV